MNEHTRVHSVRSRESEFPLLVHFTKSCMLMLKSCLRPCFGYAQSPHFVCTGCVHYERIYHAHTWSHIQCRTSVIMVNQRLITSVVLVTCTVGQSCWTCVSRWFGCFFVKSCECVFVWSLMHLSIVHTLSHFCWKLWRPDSPLTVGPSPYHWLDRISTRTMQKHQDSLFNLRFPQAIQSTLVLATSIVGLGSHPGTDSPQNFHKGHWSHLLNWLRKLCRHTRQTPSSRPYLHHKIT